MIEHRSAEGRVEQRDYIREDIDEGIAARLQKATPERLLLAEASVFDSPAGLPGSILRGEGNEAVSGSSVHHCGFNLRDAGGILRAIRGYHAIRCWGRTARCPDTQANDPLQESRRNSRRSRRK